MRMCSRNTSTLYNGATMARDNKNTLSAELRSLLKRFPDTVTMELLVPDILGILRGKRIRRSSFEKACTEPFWFCAARS